MPCGRLILNKRATIARRYRSFYDNSRSCGAAKNLRILAQLKDELTKCAHFLHFHSTKLRPLSVLLMFLLPFFTIFNALNCENCYVLISFAQENIRVQALYLIRGGGEFLTQITVSITNPKKINKKRDAQGTPFSELHSQKLICFCNCHFTCWQFFFDTCRFA